MESFLKWAADMMDVEVSMLSADTKYGELPQWDSMMHLRLVMEIEEEFDVEIPIDKVPEIKTMGDFYAYIEK